MIDECQLFGSGLLPRPLAEDRKFGVGVVLAHQYLGQLTGASRDAAQASASSVLAFRSVPADAPAATARLGSWPGAPLTRLPNLTAAATVSLPEAQTAALTLEIHHNRTSAPRA